MSEPTAIATELLDSLEEPAEVTYDETVDQEVGEEPELATSDDEERDTGSSDQNSDDQEDEDDINEEDIDDDVEPTVSTESSEVPTLLQSLEFGSLEDKEEVLNKFASIIYNEPQFAAEYLVPQASEFLRILTLITKPSPTENEHAARTSLLSYFCMLFALSDDARKCMVPHIDAIIFYLRSNDAVDRQSVLEVLEQLAEDEPSTRTTIEASLKAHLYDSMLEIAPETILSGIETYENVVIYDRERSITLFLHAGAYDFVLHHMKSPDVKHRLAAQSCLTQVYSIAERVDNESDQPGSVSVITGAFIHSLHDESVNVVTAAINFLHGTGGDEVKEQFLEDIEALKALIISLSYKRARTIGTGLEWLLIKLGDDNEYAMVKEGFGAVWKDDNILVETKIKIVKGVIDSFLDIRTAALEAGLCDLLMDVVRKKEEHRASVLVVLDKLMEEEQLCGYYLLKTDCVDSLLDVFEGTSPEDSRLAASVLARLLDCYSPGERVAQREIVAKALMASNVLSRLMKGLYSDVPQRAGGAAIILAEILLEEDGDQSWSYEAESGRSPPPTPRKDQIITAELASHVIGLIQKQDVAKEALYLLCQFCWGYPRGFGIVQKSFEPIIPSADAFFFASLCGEYSSEHPSRQRRRVAEAALKAGALPRTFELLESQAGSDAAHRRAAVEGLRVILCANSVDVDIARRDATLPGVLASLVADETKDSLSQVVWILRLLQNEEDQTWILKWKVFGNSTTIDHLVNLLNLFPYNLDPEGTKGPDPETMDEAAYEKASDAYLKELEESKEACTKLTDLVVELIRLALPILGPHSSAVVGPLLVRSHEMYSNSEILDTLNKLMALTNGNAAPLVDALRHLLSIPSPPSINQFQEWVCSGAAMSTAAREAGLADWLFDIIAADEEDERYYQRGNAFTTLGTLVDKTVDAEHALGLKQKFFDNQKALELGIEQASDEDDKFSAATAVDALWNFSKDYPEGLGSLQRRGLLSVILKLFNDPDTPARDVVPLLAQLCVPGEEKLTDLLRSYIAALVPPTDEPGNADAKEKKKKKKKKKTYVPRMGESELWERFTLIAHSTPAARQCAFDAGVIPAARSPLDSDDSERWDIPLKALRAFVQNDDTFAQPVSDLLPRVAELLMKDGPPYTLLLNLARAFLPAHIEFLVSSGVLRSLLRALGEFPSSFDDMSELIDTIHTIAESPVGRPALISQLSELLTADNVEEYESSWGYVYALRRILDSGNAGPSVVADAGGAQFALRLLKSEEVTIIGKTANLCAYLAISEPISSLPYLLENGAVKLVDNARTKALELAARTYSATEEPVDTDAVDSLKYECDMYTALAEKMAEVLRVFNGETEEFMADYC